MSFDNAHRQRGPVASRAAGFVITLSLIAGCGGFSASSLMSNGPGANASDETAEPTQKSAGAANSDRDRVVFAGLTEEDNTERPW